MTTDTLRRALAAGADAADRFPDWPAASLAALRDAGVFRWAVPADLGGTGRAPADLLDGAVELAAACATTAFAVSQRDAAVRQLLAGPDRLRAAWLPRAAAGDAFLTVGLSQLTTSRRHGAAALRAAPAGPGFRLDGEVPWVTGADRAAAVVVGAVLPDGLQALFVLPGDAPGVTVGPPMALAALVGSRTARVRCDGVELGPDALLAGPAERVLGPAGGGGLDTSAVALGLAAAAVGGLRDAGSPAAGRLAARLTAARQTLRGLAAGGPRDAVLGLRVEATRLALRAAQANLVAARGSGFVAPHPAQRLARQALFLLVWSAPPAVTEGVAADLLAGFADPTG